MALSREASAVSQAKGPYDLARLERSVRALVAERDAIAVENRGLCDQLENARIRLKELDGQLLAEGQRRRAAIERIDELIGRLGQGSSVSQAGDDGPAGFAPKASV